MAKSAIPQAFSPTPELVSALAGNRAVADQLCLVQTGDKTFDVHWDKMRIEKYKSDLLLTFFWSDTPVAKLCVPACSIDAGDTATLGGITGTVPFTISVG